MAPGGELALKTSLQDDFVELQIKDSGRGIPEHILPHIFDTLFSTKPAGPGLGLPIVHRIITDHRGTIRVEDNRPTGTVFTLDLPLT